MGVDGSCGVAGGAEYDGTGAWCDGGFELCGGDFEVVVDCGFDEYGCAFGEACEFGVADPIGGGDDDFVAGVEEGEECEGDALLGSVGDEDL